LLCRNSSRSARLGNGLMQRASRHGFTCAHDVARAGDCGSDDGIIVADSAGGFRAARIDAQVVSHGIVLAQASANGRLQTLTRALLQSTT